MARPQKEGIDYFPLDVDIDQDDKIALIEAKFGITGFAVIIKILMKIYKNGYFYEWTEREQLLFSKRINVDINQINDVINEGVKWGIFDSKLIKEYKILTSAGIQRRYLKATERRQRVGINKNYLLLSKEEIISSRNLIIDDSNSNSKEINECKNSKSKVKDNKEKENITNDNTGEKLSKDNVLAKLTNFRKAFYEQFNEVAYRTWIEPCKISEDNKEVIIEAPDDFKKAYLESKYKRSIELFYKKHVKII